MIIAVLGISLFWHDSTSPQPRHASVADHAKRSLPGGTVASAADHSPAQPNTAAAEENTIPENLLPPEEETKPGSLLPRTEISAATVKVPPAGDPNVKDSAAAAILSKKHDLSDPSVRAEVVRQLRRAAAAENETLRRKAEALGHPLVDVGGEVLVGYDGDQPLYDVDDNANAAISIATNLVRETGPYNVDGDGLTIGLWEASGIPRLTHNEIAGRVTVGDGSTTTSSHASHVAGTLIASGNNTSLKGMAPKASLIAHRSGSDVAEMTALAAASPHEPGTIYVSNHSYSYSSGWSEDPWRWYGTFSDDGNPANDYPEKFGRYRSATASWDGLVWNAPYYLPFKSAGNARNDDAPPSGTIWRHNSSSGTQYTYDPATHPLADYAYRVSNDVEGFDTITDRGCAKNVVTVGAVTDAVSGGQRNVSRASLNSFSSAGPADDGRIKPDIVANGNSVLSLDDDHDTDTTSKSGTSMSTPGACGSALLLQEYYADRFPGQAMRASTLKALILHTADDMGNPGPDYRFGWGLMNTRAAAELIREHADNTVFQRMLEATLSNQATDTYSYYWDGSSPIRIMLCWTDPAGASTTAHDSRTPRLVNDLNLKLTGPNTVTDYYPYIMPWVGDWTDATLNANATNGVNTVDNVEQVALANPRQAGIYTVTVDHTGSLSQGPQVYSLIASGGWLAGTGYGEWVLDEYPAQWNDAAVNAFSADPDQNGVPNGIEYAMNIARGSAVEPQPDLYTVAEEVIDEITYFTVTYQRDTSKTDITYQAMWSNNLENWQPVNSIVQSTDGAIETVKASVAVNGGKRFVRLVVTQN